MTQKWTWLKNYLEKENINQAEFADMIDWQPTRVSELLGGKRDFPANKLLSVAKILQLDLKNLTEYNYNKTQNIPEPKVQQLNKKENNLVSIDVIDVVACCGSGIETFDCNVLGQHLITLPALRELTSTAPDNIKIMKVNGDSMKPTINPDDTVWIDVSCNYPECDGLYLLRIGNKLAVKRIQINPFDNSVKIKSDNPEYETFSASNYQDVKVLGKVIYHIQKVG